MNACKTAVLKNHGRTARVWTVAALCALIALSAGCVNYKEELWFNKDLSGKAQFTITVSEDFVALWGRSGRSTDIFTAEGITQRFANIAGVTLTETTVTPGDEERTIDFSLKFASFDAFRRISRAERDTGFLGAVSFSDARDGTVFFNRTISFADSSRPISEEQVASLDKYSWESIVHFPGAVISANVPKTNMDAEKSNTVTWSYSLAILSRGSETMRAAYEVPQPGNILGMLIPAIVFFGMIFGLLKLLKPGEPKRPVQT